MVSSTRPMIELYRLQRSFGRTRAVNDVSFQVQRGQVFGFIGPNGAGKTTSMRILATLEQPDGGDAAVDGFSVTEDPDHVRRRLGFMPDYFGVYPNINVWEYLDFFARAYGLRGTERVRALNYVMDFTQLDGLAQKPITGLSKGMKQRLCLGRTMIHDPSVLILDEP
ncbi:MAG: ABC transporter ATP-binding protein, partial [Planctomycetota bacterium]|nr:ABC transporter ATP-binding protein [Planctomycetota bacterium]